jgi:hypothetical protein
VSIEECLKHNLIPMFQHPDIILVITHMYFRKKSFKSAYLKCMSKSNLNGYTTGKHIQDENELLVDWSSEPSKWFSISADKPVLYCYPFTLETKRHVSDLFLNTNNPIITKLFGYNNNITIGNHNCIYYVTLYNTKGNQDEEQFPFLKHCTAPAKRIRRLRQEEEEIEKQFGNNGEI